jgi:[protein-PII] uridylyltransferase
VREKTDRGCSAVFLYCEDQDGLFAWITALLDQLGLNIMDARIITTDDGKSLNHYLVLEEDGSTVDSPTRQKEIVDTIEHGIRHPEQIQTRVNRRLPRRLKHFDVQTHITFSPDPANNRTLLRLQADDRPGLLAEVGSAFSSCGIRLHNAKIATVGAAAEDIFFITNRNNQPLDDPDQQECLRTNLNKRIEETKQ